VTENRNPSACITLMTRAELRIALGAQCLVEAFTRESGLFGDLRHAAHAGNRAERLSDERRVGGLQRLL
jgi:hypothetical protein